MIEAVKRRIQELVDLEPKAGTRKTRTFSVDDPSRHGLAVGRRRRTRTIPRMGLCHGRFDRERWRKNWQDCSTATISSITVGRR